MLFKTIIRTLFNNNVTIVLLTDYWSFWSSEHISDDQNLTLNQIKAKLVNIF